MQQMTENRFISLAPDNPDDSDTDTEPTEILIIRERPHDDVSAASDGTEYYYAVEANDDTPYFQQGAEPPTRGVGDCCYEFLERPEDLAKVEVGGRWLTPTPLTYPTLMVDAHSGALSLSLGLGTGIGPATHAKS